MTTPALLASLVNNTSVTLLFAGEPPRTVLPSHGNFIPLKEALKAKDIEKAYELSDLSAAIKKAAAKSNGQVVIADGCVLFNGEELHGEFVNRLLDMHHDGHDVQPLLNLLTKLQANPSYSARKELPLFLEASRLPIHDDGDFLAYKVVRANFRDKFSGEFDNSVGRVCQMDRTQVDDDRQNTCSRGLHFAALDYITRCYGSNGDRVVVVKINPADVVSIPYDYGNQKGRTWRYEVVQDIGILGTDLDLLPKASVVSYVNGAPVYSAANSFDEPEDDVEYSEFEVTFTADIDADAVGFEGIVYGMVKVRVPNADDVPDPDQDAEDEAYDLISYYPENYFPVAVKTETIEWFNTESV